MRPHSLVKALRALGHDVVWAIEDGPGMSDRAQARRAFQAGRIVISADYDFGELAIRGVERFVGLVILSAALEIEGAAGAVLARRIHDLAEAMDGKVIVMEPTRVRERPI